MHKCVVCGKDDLIGFQLTIDGSDVVFYCLNEKCQREAEDEAKKQREKLVASGKLCKWQSEWDYHPCSKIAVERGFCEEHAKRACSHPDCSNMATKPCSHTGALVCGVPICDEHEYCHHHQPAPIQLRIPV